MTADMANLGIGDVGRSPRSNPRSQSARKSPQNLTTSFAEHVKEGASPEQADKKPQRQAYPDGKIADRRRDRESMDNASRSHSRKPNAGEKTRSVKSEQVRETSTDKSGIKKDQSNSAEGSTIEAASGEDPDDLKLDGSIDDDRRQDEDASQDRSQINDVQGVVPMPTENTTEPSPLPTGETVVSQAANGPSPEFNDQDKDDQDTQAATAASTEQPTSPGNTKPNKTPPEKRAQGTEESFSESVDANKDKADIDTKPAVENDTNPSAHEASPLKDDTTGEKKNIDPASVDEKRTANPTETKIEPMQEKRDPTPMSSPSAVSHSPATSEKPSPAIDRVPYQALPVEIGLRSLSGSKEISIDLAPKELGRVNIILGVDSQSQATVNFYVEQPQTLALLKHDASHIRQSLEQAGLVLTDGSLQFSMQNGDSSSSGFRNQTSDTAPNSSFGRSPMPVDDVETQPVPYQRLNLNQLDVSV